MATRTSVQSCYYRLLNVQYSASHVEIKEAFFKLAKTLHPDVNGGCPDKTKEFKLVSQAYDILSDPSLRKKYDWESGAHHARSRANWKAAGDFQSQASNGGKNADWGKVYAPKPPPGFEVFDHQLWYEMHYNGGDLKEALERGRSRRQEVSSRGSSHPQSSNVISQRRGGHTSNNFEHLQKIKLKDDIVARMNFRRANRRKRRALDEIDQGCTLS